MENFDLVLTLSNSNKKHESMIDLFLTALEEDFPINVRELNQMEE
jgi:hypothetical protein